jgi:hypothetical protein
LASAFGISNSNVGASSLGISSFRISSSPNANPTVRIKTNKYEQIFILVVKISSVFQSMTVKLRVKAKIVLIVQEIGSGLAIPYHTYADNFAIRAR